MSAALNAPVFVIGLERCKTERYEFVLNWLKERGVGARLWRAVDGQAPFEYEQGERTARLWLKLRLMQGRGRLSLNEIGCYLSHYRLMKHALAQGWERLFVLEDDMQPSDAFSAAALDEIARLPQEFEYVHFGNWKDDFIRAKPVARLASCALHKPISGYRPRITQGYAVSRRGMEKLVARLMPIERAIDIAILHCGLDGFGVFATKPHLARVRDIETSIHTAAAANASGRGLPLPYERIRRLHDFLTRGRLARYRARCERAEAAFQTQQSAAAR